MQADRLHRVPQVACFWAVLAPSPCSVGEVTAQAPAEIAPQWPDLDSGANAHTRGGRSVLATSGPEELLMASVMGNQCGF